jgi:hypothetical protein
LIRGKKKQQTKKFNTASTLEENTNSPFTSNFAHTTSTSKDFPIQQCE